MADRRKKYGRAAIISFGSSAISFTGDPPLSALSLRRSSAFSGIALSLLYFTPYGPDIQTGISVKFPGQTLKDDLFTHSGSFGHCPVAARRFPASATLLLIK
jgi:hypothetical protein